MITIHPAAEDLLRNEKGFELWKHEGLLCCVIRMNCGGNLNGYVAVSEGHPLFKKLYSDKVAMAESPEFNGNYIGLLCMIGNSDHEVGVYPLDMAIQVHGGLTYSRDHLYGIDENVFGELWWFGFDTAHAGDVRPFQTDIDRAYPIGGCEVYRDFEYVKAETIKLADQLKSYSK